MKEKKIGAAAVPAVPNISSFVLTLFASGLGNI